MEVHFLAYFRSKYLGCDAWKINETCLIVDNIDIP